MLHIKLKSSVYHTIFKLKWVCFILKLNFWYIISHFSDHLSTDICPVTLREGFDFVQRGRLVNKGVGQILVLLIVV